MIGTKERNKKKKKKNESRSKLITWPIILWRRIFSLSRILIATFSPVSTWRANFTFAKVPSPSVLPSSYFPTLVRAVPLPLPLPPLLILPPPLLRTPPPQRSKLSHSFPSETPQSVHPKSIHRYQPFKWPSRFFLQGCHTWDFSILIFLPAVSLESKRKNPRRTYTGAPKTAVEISDGRRRRRSGAAAEKEKRSGGVAPFVVVVGDSDQIRI